VSEELVLAAQALRAALGGFEPALLSGDDCAAVVEELAAVEKACAAARARAAVRAERCGAHQRLGFTDAAEWLARTAGSSAGEARVALDTATAVETCPKTQEALVAGLISLTQAKEITRAEAERPGSEAELLGVARQASLTMLKDAARKKRLEAVDPADLHRRQVQARELRHWQDDLGMVWLRGALPPEVGIPFVNRLDAETDRVRRLARRDGAVEPRSAHAADAFVKLVAEGGKGKANRADLVVVCDLGAYRRGHVHDDERCHLVGGGPVPVSVARDIGSDDAFVKAVLHDGVKIDTVAHFGRHLGAELRTALELGHAPDFDGVRCIEAGCGRRYGLEWDHVDPRANQGVTSYENLEPRCWPHHREKTERDRRTGLLRGTGARRAPP
jgi:hypothetical protein